MASLIKCNSCNIVISEILAFIQNQVDVMNEDSIIRLCATAFSSENIVAAKDLLYQSVPTSERKVTRKGKLDRKVQRDLEDIISLIKCTSPDLLPIFVARDLRKLPAVSFDHIDVSRLLKDIITLKDQVQGIKEQYVTLEQLSEVKLDLLNLKQASLVNGFEHGNYVNIKRGSRNLVFQNNESECDSGPIGILDISQEILISPEREVPAVVVKKKAADRYDSPLVQRQVQGQARESAIQLSPPNEGCKQQNIISDVCNCNNVDNNMIKVNHNENERRTFSKIVQEGGEFTNDRQENWITVQRKRYRNRFIGVQGQSIDPKGKFKAADIKVPLFINNVDKESTTKDIVDYILNKTSVNVQLAEIKMKYQKDYKAYKVFVPRHKLEMFLDHNLWPEGIAFRRFINFRERKESSGSPSRGNVDA